LKLRRSVGEIVASTARLYGIYPWLFLILAAAVMAPWDLVRLAVTGYGSLGHGHHEGVVEELSLELLSLALVVPLIAALHIRAAVVIGKGGRPRLRGIARSGVRVLPLVAAAALVGSVGVTAAFVAIAVALSAVGAGVLAFLLLIPGVLVFIRLSVVAQAAAVEQDGVIHALRRSWQITRGCGLHVFGLLFVVGAATKVAVALGGLAVTSASHPSPGAIALGIAVDSMVASFTALTAALLYFDLIARQGEATAAPAPAFLTTDS